MNHQFILLAAAEPRMFGLDLVTVTTTGFMLINVSVLALILSLLLYIPVRTFMKARADRIKGQIDDAQKEAADAAALKSKYEGLLREAGAQSNQIIEEARRQAAENAKRIIAEAKSEAESLKARATADIEMERERAREEMRQAIIEISAAMTEKLVAVSIDRAAHERLFAETMAELEGTSWQS